MRWLGTAGFELRFGVTCLLVDPFLSREAEARPILRVRARDLDADAILVTHGHFDHASDVPELVAQTMAPVYASASVCEALHDLGVPARRLHPLAGGRVCEVGQVSVLAFAARHARFDAALVWRALRRMGWRALSALRPMAAYPRGDVLGYQLATQHGTLVHLGSAGWYRQELERLHPDVALLPLQGHSRIHELVAQATEWLAPKRVVVHHFDDFYPPVSEFIDVQPFVGLVNKRLPETEVVVPRIGEWMSFL
jgi:L-ascorbate metabolism protein UlaG (beta-lactamase superfamily)